MVPRVYHLDPCGPWPFQDTRRLTGYQPYHSFNVVLSDIRIEQLAKYDDGYWRSKCSGGELHLGAPPAGTSSSGWSAHVFGRRLADLQRGGS